MRIKVTVKLINAWADEGFKTLGIEQVSSDMNVTQLEDFAKKTLSKHVAPGFVNTLLIESYSCGGYDTVEFLDPETDRLLYVVEFGEAK